MTRTYGECPTKSSIKIHGSHGLGTLGTSWTTFTTSGAPAFDLRRALDDAAALSDRCAGGPVASGAVEVEDAAEAATGRDGCGMRKFFRQKKLGKNGEILGGFKSLRGIAAESTWNCYV